MLPHRSDKILISKLYYSVYIVAKSKVQCDFYCASMKISFVYLLNTICSHVNNNVQTTVDDDERTPRYR